MDGTAQVGSERSFRSPRRILVRFFRKSRDRWKEKYKAAKRELKKRGNEVADVRKSRQAWREKAEESETEVGRLREQVKRLQEELQAEKGSRQEAGKKGVPGVP
jgi:chromosome segregation ATPase